MRYVALLSVLAVAAIARCEIVGRTIEYKQGSTVCEGYLAYEANQKGKAPGVMVVQDWNGIDEYERMRCRMLAELGYVAFAVDIYGKGVRPKNPDESGKEAGKYYANNPLLRSRLKAALDWLGAFDKTDKSRLGVIGYCFGGMGALEVARMGAPVKGVVSFHGSLTTSNPARAGAVKAQVLVLHGANDPFVPPADVAKFKKEMADAAVHYKFVAYPGAVHAFTVKGAENMRLNGVAYNKDADERSWDEMKAFFNRVLK